MRPQRAHRLSLSPQPGTVGRVDVSDNSITLLQFEQDVARDDISYFIAGGMTGGGGNRSGIAAQITAWVEANFTSTTVGSATVTVISSAAPTRRLIRRNILSRKGFRE